MLTNRTQPVRRHEAALACRNRRLRLGIPAQGRSYSRPIQPNREKDMAESLNRRLGKSLVRGAGVLLPGAANALAARVIVASGFDAVYITGAGIANTALGVPDLGLVTLTELVEHVMAIREAVEVPLVVDGDTGFGNALNMRRTVRLLER